MRRCTGTTRDQGLTKQATPDGSTLLLGRVQGASGWGRTWHHSTAEEMFQATSIFYCSYVQLYYPGGNARFDDIVCANVARTVCMANCGGTRKQNLSESREKNNYPNKNSRCFPLKKLWWLWRTAAIRLLLEPKWQGIPAFLKSLKNTTMFQLYPKALDCWWQHHWECHSRVIMRIVYHAPNTCMIFYNFSSCRLHFRF